MHQVSYVHGERVITARLTTVAATNFNSFVTRVWVAVKTFGMLYAELHLIGLLRVGTYAATTAYAYS
ncbi:hypothetical protein BKA82DRAFT_997589 [Pisolithus tinctorius]|uniref:Uncharacterized protein n=1 Tax=Pisolithus tinctorius Marx 270 TaxID=870435 RepID=A0A0C3PIH7_PISTI|nr:hypothetical protein BKA82DRAFT_997589 [Pisolithus tinctorius]KIO07904.1 hypothetical protein M404DRAFT_997589 [Pisolithus tinctorius Marx 270]